MSGHSIFSELVRVVQVVVVLLPGVTDQRMMSFGFSFACSLRALGVQMHL